MALVHSGRFRNFFYLLCGVIIYLFAECFCDDDLKSASRATARPIPLPLPTLHSTSPAHTPLIMLSTMDGTVSAFDATSGELRFTYRDPAPAVQSWYAPGHPEYVPSVDGLLYRIDHETGEAHVVEGKFISREHASSLSNALPAGARETADAVVLTNQDSSVIFVDLQTGQVLRETHFSDAESPEPVLPSLSDSVIIVQRTSVSVRILETRTFRELANASIVHTEPRFWQHGRCVASPNPAFDQFVAYTTDTRDRVSVRNIRTGKILWSKDVATPVVEVHGLGGVRIAGSISEADAIAEPPQALPPGSQTTPSVDPTLPQNVVIVEKNNHVFAMLPDGDSADVVNSLALASRRDESVDMPHQAVREYTLGNKINPRNLDDEDKLLAIPSNINTGGRRSKVALRRATQLSTDAVDIQAHHVGFAFVLLSLVGTIGYIVGSRPRRRQRRDRRLSSVPKRQRTQFNREGGQQFSISNPNLTSATNTDYETDFEDNEAEGENSHVLPSIARPVLARDGAQIESSTGSNGSSGGFVCNRSESGWMTVGCLLVSSNVLGVGSHGTVVYEGKMMPGERKVAVKRLLRQFYESARKEISLLVELDEASPHVVRYFAMEEDSEFIYLALELCAYSLAECISGRLPPVPPIEYEKGPPPPFTSRALRQLLQGLSDLHRVGVVHRDVKPQNVLITRSNAGVGDVKLADVGLALRLAENRSSYTAVTNAGGGIGTTGWRAPEVLSGGRQTKAVDIFAVGCMVSSILTGGDHPFGNAIFRRDGNIAAGKPSLEALEALDIPEATDIVQKMISSSSTDRPTAEEALQHPFFWTDATKLSFLVDISDRLYDLRHHSIRFTENLDRYHLARRYCSDWLVLMDMDLLSNLGREYENSASGLLRVIRNKRNHYSELPFTIRKMLGPIPEDRSDGEESDLSRDGDCNFLTYFTKKVPHLMMCVYQFALENSALTDQPHFERYGLRPSNRERESLELHPLVAMRREAMSVSQNSSATLNGGSRDSEESHQENSGNGQVLRITYHRHQLVEIQMNCEEIDEHLKRRLISLELFQPSAFVRNEKRLKTIHFSDSDFPEDGKAKPNSPPRETEGASGFSREPEVPTMRGGRRRTVTISPYGFRPNNVTAGNGEEVGRGQAGAGGNTVHRQFPGGTFRRNAVGATGITPTVSQFSGEERVVDFGALRRRS